PADLQKALPGGVALVDFLVYRHYLPPGKGAKPRWQRRLLAFVVRPDRPVVRADLGAYDPIAEAVAAWRRAAQAREHPGAGSGDPGGLLRQRLWEPLVPYLKGATTLLVSPDEDLGRLPFAALPGGKPGSYLIEEVGIGVVAVPQVLPEALA